MRPKCFFIALVFAWVIAIFVPSALVAAAGLSPLAEGRNLLSATFAGADEVAPLAKIGFILILAPLLFAAHKVGRARPALVAANILSAVAAMLLTLAFIPADYSRGFGIGLSGARFSIMPLVIYLLGAILAGLSFAAAEAKCAARYYPEA